MKQLIGPIPRAQLVSPVKLALLGLSSQRRVGSCYNLLAKLFPSESESTHAPTPPR